MDNCHIQIQSTPQIGFAHRFDTTQYEIYNIGDANQIEIWIQVLPLRCLPVRWFVCRIRTAGITVTASSFTDM